MKQERILVVDDEAIVRETIKNDLMEAGYDVVEARNGMEGVRQFKNGAIDLVISDLVMGEMDGLEVLKEVKKISPDTPVIIITGYPSQKIAKEALVLGASDIINKPAGIRTLFKAVRQHIPTSSKE